MIRQIVFTAFLGFLWAMSVQNAAYFGLPQPWGYVLLMVGAVVLGIASPQYRTDVG